MQGLWCRYDKGNSIFNTTFSISMIGYFFKDGMKKRNDIYQNILLFTNWDKIKSTSNFVLNLHH